jgi:hypothetical protein
LRPAVARILDPIIAAALFTPAMLMRRVRGFGLEKLPVTKRTLLSRGVLPVRDHYYEPRIRPDGLSRAALERDRDLPGIDLRLEAQRELLGRLRYQSELSGIPTSRPERSEGVYWFDNTYFERMDGSVWYSLLRMLKPRMVIEIGSGFSTLLARLALDRNAAESGGARCRHLCIEPYEHPWLDKSGLEVVRRRVEEVDPIIFSALGAGDVLFIDSSHVLRPGGDVVVEILQILPRLAPGVVVHVHDIFTPRDYPWDWLFEMHRLWNEQYVLEAFLSMNPSFEVMLGVQHLWHAARQDMEAACVPLDGQIPGTSFYIRRTG